MKINPEILSAYLDGEVTPEQASAIESALEKNPNLQAELEQLMADDSVVKQEFDDLLDPSIPMDLVAAIKDAPMDVADEHVPTMSSANDNDQSGAWWQGAGRWAMAASVACALVIGGIGGYVGGTLQPDGASQQSTTPQWIAAIADYHGVYAGQKRHLVEVGADEQEHLTAWLSNTIGASFEVPELGEFGLNFEGGRLLVAAGKPVAQLMYTDENGAVVAVCLLASPGEDSDIASRTLGDFDFLSWKNNDRNIVVIGDTGRTDLDQIAQSAAQMI